MNDQLRSQPFRVDVPDAALDDLRARLARTRWIDALPGAGWERGVPTDYLRELAEQWAGRSTGAAPRPASTATPQFLAAIDGQHVHYLHVRSSRPDALPLMLIHGWPGSAADFLDLVAPLTEPPCSTSTRRLLGREIGMIGQQAHHRLERPGVDLPGLGRDRHHSVSLRGERRRRGSADPSSGAGAVRRARGMAREEDRGRNVR